MKINCLTKIIFFVLIFSGFFGLAKSSLAATYYIDPTCSTSGDGTTQTCGIHGPFKTWAEVTWASGNIYSQKGGTTVSPAPTGGWPDDYGQITITASGTDDQHRIIINSYGTGNAKLYGAYTLNSNIWTEVGSTGVYYRSIPSYVYPSMLEDRVFLKQATNSSCNDGNLFFEWQTNRNYYRPTDGKTPSDHTIEDPYYYGFNLKANSYITIDGFDFENQRFGIGPYTANHGENNSNITITNCNFKNMAWGVALSTNRATATNLVISHNTFDYVGMSIELWVQNLDTPGNVGYWSGADISYNTMTHCSQVYTPSGPASYDWSEAGTAGYDNEGIGTQNLILSNVHHNITSGVCRGITLYSGAEAETHGLNVYSNYCVSTVEALYVNPDVAGTSFYNNKFYDNIFVGGDHSAWETAVIMRNTPTPVSEFNYFENNTVISNTSVGIYVRPPAYYYSIKNNIVHGTVGNYPIFPIYMDDATKANTVIDYNLYDTSVGRWWVLAGVLSYYWGDWVALGYDKHSPIPADPLFTNGSGTLSLASDFALQAASPAKWAGVDIGLTTDYAGNPVHNPPSIGAYEYVGAPPSDTTPPAAPSGVQVI